MSLQGAPGGERKLSAGLFIMETPLVALQDNALNLRYHVAGSRYEIQREMLEELGERKEARARILPSHGLYDSQWKNERSSL
jgi:hypothetical protein